MPNKVDLSEYPTLRYDSKHGWRLINVSKKEPEKKWWTILDIYWDLQRLERYMLDERTQFVNRKVGRPRKSKSPKPIKNFIEAHKSEELSSSFSFEFYLQCFQYHKGVAKLLQWCKKHLKRKVLADAQANLITESKTVGELWNNVLFDKSFVGQSYEDWKDSLDKQQENEVAEILGDSIFIRKDREGDLLSIWSGQLFENPFNYILEHVWVWNAAVGYCLERVKKMELLEPTALIAFRAVIDRLDTGKKRLKSLDELISMLTLERDGSKDRHSKQTILRELNRVKKRMPVKNKKFNW